ncbi:MAG: DUF2235 domain-containing protein [Rhodobacteraceae bacterium]|nr:DUF2235 domain-containing protein [Paracoccaceae bacterium]
MSKNIIICLDGTGNKIAKNRSSVSKIFTLLSEDCKFYDTGIGTDANFNDWEKRRAKIKSWWQLAAGTGLEEKILTPYEFLCRNYEKDDRIFIFGFSRGAYTARALAGFVHNFGLLDVNNLHLANKALVAYQSITRSKKEKEFKFKEMQLFEKTLDTYRPPIEFLGLFDTVNSVMRPSFSGLFDISILSLRDTAENFSVKRVRHALAIDEKRRFFRPALWTGTIFKQSIYKSADPTKDSYDPDNLIEQDVRQMWFAGYHADIGGSSGEDDNPLCKLSLQWMIDQSPKELGWKKQSVDRKVRGKLHKGDTYSIPNSAADIENSMSRWWKWAERLPLPKAKWTSSEPRRSFLGLVMPPIHQPRHMPTEHELHPSVLERRDKIGYKPPNLEDYLKRQ